MEPHARPAAGRPRQQGGRHARRVGDDRVEPPGVELAKELAVPTLVAEAVVNVWRIGITHGLRPKDLTAIAQLYERRAEIEIRARTPR